MIIGGQRNGFLRPRWSGPLVAAVAGGSLGLIAGSNTIGDITTTVSSNYAAVTANVTPVPIPTNGFVLRVDLSDAVDTIDPTKVRINLLRPGFDSNGDPLVGAARWSDTSLGTGMLRKPAGDYATDLTPGPDSYYITLDSRIHAPDEIVSIEFLPGFYTVGGVPNELITMNSDIGRFDTYSYKQPIVDCMEFPYTIRVATAGGSFTAEFAGVHKFARNGKPFACVKAWARNTDTSTDGPVNTASTPALSAKTPAGNPSQMRVPSYAVTIDTTGLSDGNCEIRYTVYPQVGDVVFDSTGDGLTFPTVGRPKGIPFYKDAAGKYSPIYAFVNYDGTGLTGASTAGIQTNATDPAAGADTHANSYQDINAAYTAAAAWNNNSANRGVGNVHNDASGLVVILRNVSTSTALGIDAGCYSGRTANNVAVGPLAPEIRSASGVNSLGVRFRSRNYDGTGGGAAVNLNSGMRRWASGKVLLRGIIFDTTGLSENNDNIILNLNGGGTTESTVPHLMLIDCKVRGRAAGLFFPFFQSGFRYDLRTDGQLDGLSTASSNLSMSRLAIGTLWEGQISFSNSAFGVWVRVDNASPVWGETAGATAVTKPWRWKMQRLAICLRVDGAGGANDLLAAQGGPYVGIGMTNVLIRKYNTTNTNQIGMYANRGDANVYNGVFQYWSIDAGDSTGVPTRNGRLNFDYFNEMVYGHRGVRDIVLQGCAIPEYNSKDDTHLDPQAISASAVAANTPYFAQTLVHDGAGTPTYYLSIVETITSATPLTDLADTNTWVNLGQIGGISVTNHPFRTGSWPGQWNVDRMYNAIGNDNTGQTAPARGPASWLGEVPGRGTSYGISVPDMYTDRSGGSYGTSFTDWGDYTPKSTGPLIGRVPASRAMFSHDIFGNVRNPGGAAGAAGCVEAGNIAVFS